MGYPSFLEHIRAYAGTRNWCLAHRASRRTESYDVIIKPSEYERERQAWIAKHPAMLLAQSLPESDEKRFICKAVQSRLYS